MARDIRLYIYSAGGLKALGNKGKGVHKFTSIRQCKTAITILQSGTHKPKQFVMVEYTDSYQSEIIYVSPLDLAKTI